jgi:hypothetical protein
MIDKVVVLDMFHGDTAWCVRSTHSHKITDIGFKKLNLKGSYHHVNHHNKVHMLFMKKKKSDCGLMRTQDKWFPILPHPSSFDISCMTQLFSVKQLLFYSRRPPSLFALKYYEAIRDIHHYTAVTYIKIALVYCPIQFSPFLLFEINKIQAVQLVAVFASILVKI